MNRKSSAPTIDFYQNNSKIKWIVLVISVVISISSVFYTDVLVDQLKEREKQQVVLFAKAIEYTANANENAAGDVNFVAQEILFQNNSIPIIQADEKRKVLDYRNIQVEDQWTPERKEKFLQLEMEDMGETYDPIIVPLRDPQTNEVFATQYIYYENSFLLTQIIAYPYVQLSVIAIFGIIAYLAFNYSKAAEQNRVWVGLAKETAHQLGTPLSSLMAWIEVLRDDPA
jgi:hypothetical protein